MQNNQDNRDSQGDRPGGDDWRRDVHCIEAALAKAMDAERACWGSFRDCLFHGGGESMLSKHRDGIVSYAEKVRQLQALRNRMYRERFGAA